MFLAHTSDRRATTGGHGPKCHRGIECLCLLVLLGLFQSTTKAAQRAPRAPDERDLPMLLGAANEALGRKDYSAAVRALKSVVEIDPRSVEAWFNLAFAYTGLQQNEAAVRAYQHALDLRPNLFEGQLNLGILLLEMKQAQASVDHLAKAVVLKPQHVRAHLYYGRALAFLGPPGPAEKEFLEAARLEPKLASVQSELGQLYLKEKRYLEARTAFQKAADLDPKLPQPQLGSALAWEGLNNLDEAETLFEHYLAFEPQDVQTRFHLARLYLQQGQSEKALNHLQVLHQARPDMPGLAATMGDVFALLKRYPESEKFYRQALMASPGEADLHRALGRTLLDEENYVEAEKEFRLSLKLDPRNLEAAKGLATSLYLQKRYGEAIPILQALIREPSPPAGLYFVLATCYDHLRDHSKALEAYQRFLELSHEQSPDQEWQARQRVKLLQHELAK